MRTGKSGDRGLRGLRGKKLKRGCWRGLGLGRERRTWDAEVANSLGLEVSGGPGVYVGRNWGRQEWRSIFPLKKKKKKIHGNIKETPSSLALPLRPL